MIQPPTNYENQGAEEAILLFKNRFPKTTVNVI